ncbi:MAG: lasso peptide biosynthesis B2 protein [Nitrospiraceae bacterium]
MTFRKVRLVGEAGIALCLVRLLSRMAPLPRVMGWLHIEPSAQALAHPERETLDDLAYYTDRWLSYFPAPAKGNCFPRSLTLYRLARRLGFPVTLYCGIQKNGQALDGHAWLALNGKAFLEATRHWEGFAVTYSYPPQKRVDSTNIEARAEQPQRRAVHS